MDWLEWDEAVVVLQSNLLVVTLVVLDVALEVQEVQLAIGYRLVWEVGKHGLDALFDDVGLVDVDVVLMAFLMH